MTDWIAKLRAHFSRSPSTPTADLFDFTSTCNCKPFSVSGDTPGVFSCDHCGAVWGTAGATALRAHVEGEKA